VLYDPRFEAYVIGDLGRCFNLLAKIETRKGKYPFLESANKRAFFDDIYKLILEIKN
jgi:hypothetical protein